MTNQLPGLEPHLVIVGGGATGAAVLASVLRDASLRLKITIVEPAPRLGLGKAYSTEDSVHILNVPVEKMTLYEDLPTDFLKWVESKKDPNHAFEHWPFVPRIWFGEYVGDRLHEPGSERFHHHRDRVVSLRRQNQKWVLNLTSLDRLIADFVVIATGYGESEPLNGLQAIQEKIVYPYDSKALRSVRPEERVLVVGAGLTAIDVFRQMSTQQVKPIHFLARHGLFPLSHSDEPVRLGFRMPELAGMRPLQIMQVLRGYAAQYSAQHSSGPPPWGAIADQVRPQAQKIWVCWNERERKQFFRHLKTYWEIARHRIPSIVANDLKKSIEQKKIQIHAGNILSSSLNSDETITVKYSPRHEKDLREIHCDRIILAAGHPVDQSLAGPHSFSGVIRAPLGLGYLNKTGKNLWLAGPSSRYSVWEVSAMPEIRRQIATILKELKEASVKSLKEKNSPIENYLEKFTYHPHEAKETYSQHFFEAFMIGMGLLRLACFVAVHALIPFKFTDTTSDLLRDFSFKINHRRLKKLP